MDQSLAGILSPAEAAYAISQNEDNTMLISLNGGGCQLSCNTLEVLGPPPDTILTIPPPPIPNFLLETLNANKSNNESCNLCNIFTTGTAKIEDKSFPQASIQFANTWICVIIIVSIVSIAVGAIIAIFFMKCKKWKIFPVADSCPILPENFLNNKNSSSETSPKSMDSSNLSKQKTKETKLKSSLKYWQRECSQEYPLHRDGSQYIIGNDSFVDSEENKSPGTPIYAELDVTPGFGTNRIDVSNCSPYAIHTYAGIDNELQNPNDLINNGAYDNAAFFPSEGKKSPSNTQAYLPKITQQSLHPSIPKWSNSVPSSPVPSYPQKIHPRQTYSLGRKAMKTDDNGSSLPTMAKVKILHNEDTSHQFQKNILPTQARGSILEGFHKRPLPPIPLEHVHNMLLKNV